MGLNPYYTTAIVATIGALVLLLSPPPRNYALASTDYCVTRLSFDGRLRHRPKNEIQEQEGDEFRSTQQSDPEHIDSAYREEFRQTQILLDSLKGIKIIQFSSCTLTKVEDSLMDAALVLVYACVSVALVTLTFGIHGRSKILSFLVIVTTLLQGTLLCLFLVIVFSLDAQAGAGVYLQALIFTCWTAASIWHLTPRKIHTQTHSPFSSEAGATLLY